MFPTEPLTALNAGRMLEWKVIWLFVVFFLCFFSPASTNVTFFGQEQTGSSTQHLTIRHHKVIELHNLLDEKQHDDKVHSFSTERS